MGQLLSEAAHCICVQNHQRMAWVGREPKDHLAPTKPHPVMDRDATL